MLMTPITPNVMARPMAASSSTEPSDRPYQAFCSACHRFSVKPMEEAAAAAAALTAGDASGAAAARFTSLSASPSPRAFRVAMAASRSASEPAPEVATMAARGLEQRGLDGRVALPGERRVHGGDGLGIGRVEGRVGGGQALRTVRRQQVEAADRGGDLRPDGVVEADLLQAALHHALGLGTGGGVVERAGAVEVIDAVAAGVEEQAPVRQGAEHGRCRRGAAGDELVDAALRFGEPVGREMRQRVVDRGGAGRRGGEGEEGGQDRDDPRAGHGRLLE